MRRFIEEMKEFFKKGDMVLLIMCLITSGLGVVIITSATSAEKFGSNVRYIVMQLLAIGIIGEYIGKIYLETKHRPTFLISDYLDDET